MDKNEYSKPIVLIVCLIDTRHGKPLVSKVSSACGTGKPDLSHHVITCLEEKR